MRNRALTFKIFLAIVFNDLGDCLAQLLMKKGLVQTGIHFVGWHNLGEFIARNGSSGWVWGGVLIYALNFFVWILILSRVDLSVAMPIGSTSYLLIPLAAVIFLGEQISPLRWLGLLLIVAGIHFVSKSPSPVLETSR